KIREQVSRRLETEIERETRDNPRVSPSDLGEDLQIDNVVSRFKGVLRSGRESFSRILKSRRSPKGTPQGEKKYGSEIWVELETPPFCGQLDFTAPGEIWESKTGEQDPSHLEQLDFYSMLWFLRYGDVPKTLKLLYASGITTEQASPSASDLKA